LISTPLQSLQHHNTKTGGADISDSHSEPAPAQYWGKTVRGPVRKAIYYVKDGKFSSFFRFEISFVFRSRGVYAAFM
jgi:hypothetical protein